MPSSRPRPRHRRGAGPRAEAGGARHALSLRVSPALCEEIERLLAARQGFERRKFQVTVLPDPEMTHGDAVIAWEEGSLAVNAAARRAAVLAEMGPLLTEVLDAGAKEIDPARIA